MKESDLLRELGFALQDMDWSRVDELCSALVAHIRAGSAPPSRTLLASLSALRRKRRFSCMAGVAGVLIETGRATPFVRRQYAQALIDQGLLSAAEPFLRALSDDARGTPEEDEARGLLGRTGKQQYVNGGAGAGPAVLQRAVDAYTGAYVANRARNFWHGINAVALLDRARRDGHRLTGALPVRETAEEIFQTIVAVEDANAGVTDPWLAATAMEALVALRRHDDAVDRALQYVSFGNADAFEIGSTLRQLEEVWQLTDQEEPGSSLLPLLRAALLRREGSSVTRGAKAIAEESRRVSALEKRFGPTGSRTLAWYREGLDSCSAIARIERQDRRGEGTGWLVRLGDLFGTGNDEPVVVTNAHVVCGPQTPVAGALSPEDVVVNFQLLDHQTTIVKCLWCSPVEEFDCTVLRLASAPNAAPLKLSPRKVRPLVPPPRMYIIGHPGGREIEFSLQDNHLIDCNEVYLHYRTATEGGSSGSPVFDEYWKVVGLHHKGDEQMPRLNGQPGAYAANEAVTIRSIVAAPKAG